jgi:uncharacterized protein YjbJ (UPF0337 family)
MSAAQLNELVTGGRLAFFCYMKSEEDSKLENICMDKDRIAGKAEELKGKIKEKAGELTKDKGTEAEGQAEQIKGKAREMLGKLKDAGREAKDKVREKVDPRPSHDDDPDQDKEEVA